MVVGAFFGAFLAMGWLLSRPDNALFRLFRSEISDPRAKVIIGPYPTADDFTILKNHGVSAIISLLDPALPYESALLAQERELAQRHNMRFYSFPMSSVLGMGFGAQYAEHAQQAATAAMQEPGKVYLHCYLGLHRVKVVQAIVARLGGSYDHYHLREAEREPSLRLIDAAQAYFDAGEYQQSLNQLKDLKLRNPKLTLIEGWSLYRLGRIVDAENSFREVLKQSRCEWDAYSGLGYCALQRNRLAEAEEKFSQVLKVNRADPAALIGMGIVRYREGGDADAAKYLERGLASGRPNPEAQEILRKITEERTNAHHIVAHVDRSAMPGPRN